MKPIDYKMIIIGFMLGAGLAMAIAAKATEPPAYVVKVGYKCQTNSTHCITEIEVNGINYFKIIPTKVRQHIIKNYIAMNRIRES